MREKTGTYYMTMADIDDFLKEEEKQGISKICLRSRKSHLRNLLQWLGEDTLLTRERLQAWRKNMEAQSCTKKTIDSHVKSINRYLHFAGLSEIRFRQGCRTDLTGRAFGDLQVVCSLEERERRNCLWLCRCSCGRETKVTAAKLLSGNTLSCGCRKVKTLTENNRYIEGTELGRALQENVKSSRSASGYTGVSRKNGKWIAYINYKGNRYYLGSYEQLEQAVEARGRAKERVREDAMRLLEIYMRGKEDDSEKKEKGMMRE